MTMNESDWVRELNESYKKNILLKEQESTLDTTIWSTESNSGSLRELLDSTKDSSPVLPVEIDELLPIISSNLKFPHFPTSPEEQERVKKADLNYPIVVIYKKGKVLAIPDGHHRILLAHSQGRMYINAIVIDFEVLPDKFKEIFGEKE